MLRLRIIPNKVCAKLGLLVRARFGHGILAAREERNNTFDLLVLTYLPVYFCYCIYNFAKQAIV